MKELLEQYEKIKESIKTSLKEEFPKLIDENILEVKWVQYAPYFNDGDACEFSIHHFEYKFSKELLEKMKLEDKENCYLCSAYEYLEDEGTEYAYIVVRDLEKLKDEKIRSTIEKIKNFESINRSVDENLRESVFKAEFGDHVEIIFDGKKFHINDYDHD